MSIFTFSPRTPVNRGLAEPYQSPLPTQLQFLRELGQMAREDKRYEEQKKIQEQKVADDWWNSMTEFNTEGLTQVQQEDIAKKTTDYLDKYSNYINNDEVPLNKTEVHGDRLGLKARIGSYTAFNTEAKEVHNQLSQSPALYDFNNFKRLASQISADDQRQGKLWELTSDPTVYKTDGHLLKHIDAYNKITKSEISEREYAGETFIGLNTIEHPPIYEVDQTGKPVRGSGGYEINDAFISQINNDPDLKKNLLFEIEGSGYQGTFEEYLQDKVNEVAPVQTKLGTPHQIQHDRPTGTETDRVNKLNTLKIWADRIYDKGTTTGDISETLNLISQGQNGVKFNQQKDGTIEVVANKSYLESIDDLEYKMTLVRELSAREKWSDNERVAVEKGIQTKGMMYGMSPLEVDIYQKKMRNLAIVLDEFKIPGFDAKTGKWMGTKRELRIAVSQAISRMANHTNATARDAKDRFDRNILTEFEELIKSESDANNSFDIMSGIGNEVPLKLK